MFNFSHSAPIFTKCEDYLTPATEQLPLPVDFPLPTAEDSGGAPVGVSCSHRPGDKFPLGKTTVTCNATVGSETSTCKFDVGVGKSCTFFLEKTLLLLDAKALLLSLLSFKMTMIKKLQPRSNNMKIQQFFKNKFNNINFL